MKKQPINLTKYIIKNDASEFDLHNTFNQLTMLSLNLPEVPANGKQTLPPITLQANNGQDNLVDVLSDLKGLKNTLRYIKLNPKPVLRKDQNIKQSQNKNQIPLDKQIFIRPTQAVANGNKTFWMSKGLNEAKKVKLNLDSPTFVITFNTVHPNSINGDQMLVAIERKCLTLYQIDEKQIHLKDFDSVSIGKKLNCVQVKHVQSQGRNFVLIFGNQKEAKIDYFKCLVYEVCNMQLTFVKKATITEGQIYSPTILFQTYPKNQKQKYCLVCGGCYDSRNSFYYCGWQIDLHLLLTSWLTYPTDLTKQVPFDTKRQTILSGKAVKYNDYWYVFCTQNQTISQLKLDYQHRIQLETIHLDTVALELKEKIYFSENNLFLGLKGTLKLVMLNKNLEFREKDFLEVVGRFDVY